ncbi:hypothetical protein C8D87_11748 [Lentzea atacamensis]|uniref:Uncharacterized protein n=1 Tax=Lentzea atacamensis TaxID=531938 RepID=A0ABX9DXJ2_9PSEU|nr:hypothetical protein [Lentzea atacamensis]RAS58878.1 hypothetical protein C8D87_11748 [Lentzea atacamensis]
MQETVSVLDLTPNTKIRLNGGLIVTVTAVTNRGGTATLHTTVGALLVQLPCQARLA